MAIYPCDQHGQRYKGAQQTAYPALVNGALQKRRKRRLCPDCFDHLKNWVQTYLAPVTMPDEQRDYCVGGCDTKLDLPFAVFVTLYAEGEDRDDWYGRCCLVCAESGVGLALFGEQGPLL